MSDCPVMRDWLAQEADLKDYDRRMLEAERLEKHELRQLRRFWRYIRVRETGAHKAVRAKRLDAARVMGRHSRQQWLALVETCGGKCVRCGAQGRIEKDHIVPLYMGGCDCIGNLQPLCGACNGSKGPECIDFRPPHWSPSLAQ